MFFIAHSRMEYKSLLKRSIWPIDETLTGTNIPGQSGTGSNIIGGVLLDPQNLTTRCILVSYAGYNLSLGEFYPSRADSKLHRQDDYQIYE